MAENALSGDVGTQDAGGRLAVVSWKLHAFLLLVMAAFDYQRFLVVLIAFVMQISREEGHGDVEQRPSNDHFSGEWHFSSDLRTAPESPPSVQNMQTQCARFL